MLIFGLLALVVVPVYPHFVSPNELTRWAAAAAVVEEGTFAVDSIAPMLGPRFEDLSTHGGRLFSNKAPGGALVGLPGYLAARPFAGPPSPASMRAGVTAMRLAAATLPAVVLALLLPAVAARFGGETRRAPLVAGALLFATPLLAYGLLLFSHALVALCLFGAWAALFLPAASPRTAARRELLAGALMGLAVISEYPVAVAAAVLFVFAGARRDARRLARVALGGLPFALALLAYDAVCFGGPFELSSAHERFAAFGSLASGGIFGIGWPSAARVASLLLDPGKGLLLFSPLLLLVPHAFVVSGFVLPKDAFRALLVTPAVLVLLYSGYPNWHGGWTVGARYLVAALPFLLFPLAFRDGGRLEAALLGASAGAVALTALTFPFAPNEMPLPWASQGVPLLAQGLVVPNLLHLVARPLAVAVPFLLVAAGVAVAAGRRAGWAALGAAVWVGGSLLVPSVRQPSLGARAARGYIEEVYFEREGALRRSLPVEVPAPLRERLAQEKALPPPSWPF